MIAPSKPAIKLPPALIVVRDLAAAVWARRLIALLFFCCAMAAVLVGIMVCPRTYQSEAKLFVRLGRESVTLDPTATTGQTISVHESRENELNSVLDTLESRVIFSTVVDKLGPDVILEGGPPPTSVGATASAVPGTADQPDRPSGGLFARVGLSDPMSRREMAIAALSRSVFVSATKKSNVISIGCKAPSPELAQRIVDEVIAAFQAKHREVNRTEGSYDFFVAQSAELKRKYEAAAEKLARSKNALGVGTIEARRTTIQNQIATLEGDLLNARKTLAATEASITSTKSAMGRLPETVLSQQVAGSPNSAVDQTRKQLADLRLQEQTLRMRYRPAHPLVVAASRRIERAEELLGTMDSQDLQKTNVPNPALQQLELRLLADESQAASLAAQAEQIERQLADAKKSLQDINDFEGRLTVLENDRDVLAASYKEYEAKLEQTRLDRELGLRGITNVNILQPATFVARPVVPDKRLIFLAGLVFAASGAIGLAIALEYWRVVRDTIRRPTSSPNPAFDRRRPSLQEA